MLTRKSVSYWFVTCAVAFTSIGPALAQQQQVFLSEPTGVSNNWSTAPVLTRGETIPLLGGAGNFTWDSNHVHFDGLGAFRRDADTLTVYVNHENGAGSVSRVDLSVPLLQTWITNRVIGNDNTNYAAKPAGLLKGMSKAWTSVAGGLNQNLTMTNPCSGNAWEPNTFGPGRGFTDRLYLNGEETFGTNPTGHYWALDTATNTLYQAPDVGGLGSWESATVIDTGRTDTIALLLGEDRGASTTGTARLSLYVGTKNPGSSDFLARNGLVGGKTYYWDANGTSNTNGTVGAGGLFANNNDSVQGTWTQTPTEAVLFSKAEDVHTNMQPSSPKFGKEAVLASQDQAIFQIDFSGITFTAGDLTPGSTSNVKVLLKNGTDDDPVNDFSGFDNLVWSADGNLYVNEDDGEGDIWQVNVAGLNAQYQNNDLNPSLSNVFQILDADMIGAHTGGVALGITESSGIIDISSFVGYAPGSIFLADGQGTSSDQLVLLVSPTAAVIPEPSVVASCLILVVGAAVYRRRK